MNLPVGTTVLGLSPFEQPDSSLVAAVARAGALGLLDLGHDPAVAREALARAARRIRVPFGVRFNERLEFDAVSLPEEVAVVVVPAARGRFAWDGRDVLVQVSSIEEARAAAAGGASGLIVKGHEASGRIGEETTFVLLQRVLGETTLPVWAQGGIGVHTAAACVAAGAQGVVLDTQLALLEEAATSAEVRRMLGAMDGSETIVAGGYRLFARVNARKPAPSDGPEEIAKQLGADDPATHLITLGQDAAFARAFAERFASVSRAIDGVRSAIEGHIRQARSQRPLARSSPLAEDLGIEFPIAQGPMTRVSDRAAFAEAVSKAGALPFLALSLMRGAELRALLDETRERLAGRAWGVGILGFLPAETRDEQIALLREVAPPIALIAGGRPSQSLPLEQAGIKTFLHVPSPGLLELFLKEGARRFVFEGRECGGHVGPRSSFVLWESAIEKLLARGTLHDISVLFAGGIHDARSASMVAALAAPLAARGAKVGVLMGTAYLFTDEVVACGAIAPGFQEEAILCERTALLETAPGHATRCAETKFVRAFERERERLAAEGTDPQTAWAALEQLNLGRLRLAAKGLRREGELIVPVGDDEQRREGMYMIGQVASLRNARCTLAELHRDVSDGSTAALAAIDLSKTAVPLRKRSLDVAIVGMACIFPDAPDLAAYWKNIVVGHNAVREVPPGRWNVEAYYDPAGTGETVPSKWGGFLQATVFDPSAYGIPPRSIASIDPTQLLALEIAKRALDDAGYDEHPLDRERTSIVFGTEPGGDLPSAYAFRGNFAQFIEEMPAELSDSLPRLTEDSFPGVLGNVVAGRIANRLDLRGANYTVDAACASSLTAIHAACKELVSGTSDVVIAGGADLHNGIHDFQMFSCVHALSKTGQSRPFDAQADGIALGEGVGAVVLKRLEDAEHDGDRIYAVLRGVGASSDGKSLGLTAPRKEGQLRALERAWESVAASPATIGLVEAHGTGTVVGDRTELATLEEFFGNAGALPASCTLGSVKGQIGHTKCAAGMAGLIKAALAVHHGVLPPTKNITSPNPAYDAATSPFVFRDVAAPWTSTQRLAAVSAFGFGGANFHVVLESHAGQGPATAALTDWPAELFVVRGDDAQARKTLDTLEAIAASDMPPPLRDLAAGAANAHAGAPARFAIVAKSHADLRAKIAQARLGRNATGVYAVAPLGGEVAFLFPGQGSQRPKMLAELFVTFPELRDLLELGAEWYARMFPGGAYTPEQRSEQLRAITATDVAQPALGIADLAMARLLARAGVRPAMAAGHSYGELVALALAGAFDERTLLSLSAARARSILEAAPGAPGTMAAVRATPAAIRRALGDDAGVVFANHNAPDQVVIAGSEDAVDAACETLAAAEITAKRLSVACAFHSPLVAGARERFAAVLAEAEIAAPSFPVYSNTFARPYGGGADDVRRTLAEHVAEPVRFVDEIEAMYAAGARVFVEAGPGAVLSDLAARILGDRPHATIACDAGEGGVTGFLDALARVVAAGVPVGVGAFFEGRATAIDLANPPAFAAPPTAWLIDGGGSRPLSGDLPDFAMRPLGSPVSLATAPAPPAGDRDAAVHLYLQTMRELVEGQRQVMLRFLDAGSPVRPLEFAAVGDGREAVDLHEQQPPAALPAAAAQPIVAPQVVPTPMEALLSIVSERTGYPVDMLDPDLDIEADLGIDSIKRIEILGAVRERLGDGETGNEDSAFLERLAAVKTLREIAALLEASSAKRASSAGTTPALPASVAPTLAEVVHEAAPPSIGAAIGRYVVVVEPLPPVAPIADFAGRRFTIVPDACGVAPKLGALLEAAGAAVRFVAADELLEETDALVHLGTFGADVPDALLSLFSRVKEAMQKGATTIVAATAFGGRFGHHSHPNGVPPSIGGVAGLLKSFAKEHPDVHVRAIDLDPGDDAARLAGYVLCELAASAGPLEVGYVDGMRNTLSAERRAATDEAASPALDIGADSVVLITGGARGITARIAIAMAQRYRCTFELVGRSTPGEEEDVELSAATDAASLRRLLVSRMNGNGPAGPAAVEAEVRRILAGREINVTLAAIRAAGARVNYHSLDVRDEDAFGALIDVLRERHGRIDGVVHAAGLIEDKLLRDKTHESFARVFSTKVLAARVLAAKLSAEARFFVMFSSISGAFGNRGQTDYAAANDALDKMAHHLHRTVPGRVLAINWGPWSGAGMVGPELQREYERRGVALIPLETGIERFFQELHGGADAQVIISAATGDGLA